MRLAVATLLLLGLGACASGPGARQPPNAFGPNQEELAEQCTARRGILAPSGRNTGRPSLDFTCRIPPSEGSPRVRDPATP